MKALILAAAIALAAAAAPAADLAWIDSQRGRILLTNEPVYAGTRTAVLEYKLGHRMLGSWDVVDQKVFILWLNGNAETYTRESVHFFKHEVMAP